MIRCRVVLQPELSPETYLYLESSLELGLRLGNMILFAMPTVMVHFPMFHHRNFLPDVSRICLRPHEGGLQRSVLFVVSLASTAGITGNKRNGNDWRLTTCQATSSIDGILSHGLNGFCLGLCFSVGGQAAESGG